MSVMDFLISAALVSPRLIPVVAIPVPRGFVKRRRSPARAREFVSMRFGETIPVKAQIHTLNGFSAHAGQTGINSYCAMLRGNNRVCDPQGQIVMRMDAPLRFGTQHTIIGLDPGEIAAHQAG